MYKRQTWEVEAAEKCGYAHFMQKEIAEQPKARHDTLSPSIKDGRVSIPELTLTDEEIKNIGKIHIVACGSADVYKRQELNKRQP